jgi:hypothetical protein
LIFVFFRIIKIELYEYMLFYNQPIAASLLPSSRASSMVPII